MRLFSDAVDENGFFDARYTCDVDNSSPELRWEDPPVSTVTFVLIAEDLDGRNPDNEEPFCHWVVYNIPGELKHLPAGIPPQDLLPNGIRQGLNSNRKLGYFGPCPPKADRAHRYCFRLFALANQPELPNRATRSEVLSTIRNDVIAEAVLEGYYKRMLEKAG